MKIVTGMYRSGTSLICQILSEIGQDFGDPAKLIEADKFNSNGYFENIEIINFNGQVISGPLAISNYYLGPPSARPRLSAVYMGILYLLNTLLLKKNIIKRGDGRLSEMEALSSKFKGKVVKDPKFSLTIGSWNKNIKIKKIIYCYRNPVEVAYSVKKAMHFPLFLSFIVWKLHIREFLRVSDNLDVQFINYNNLLHSDNWKDEVKRLYEFAEKDYSEEEALSIKEKIIDKRLNHGTRYSLQMSRDVELLHEKLNQCHSSSHKMSRIEEFSRER